MEACNPTFGGINLLRILSEAVIAWINLFFQHYQISSTLVTELQILLEALQLEAGSNKYPLLLPC